MFSRLPYPWRPEARKLLRLGGPLIVNNLAVAGMQFADAVMAGQLGARSLAAVAVGGSVWFLGFSIVMGLLMALSPIAARLYGSGSYGQIGRYTRQGIVIGVAAGVLLLLLGQLAMSWFMALVGIDIGFRDLTTDYVAALTLGAPAIFVFLALRFTTEGVGRTRPIMYTSLLALVTNVFLNYVLMFGRFGAPELGTVGCGYASAITMWLIMIVLTTHMAVSRHYKGFALFSRLTVVRPSAMKEILLLGTPIAVTITAETGLFSAISILMGTRGAEISAAHQVAINFSATTFMIPLALSSAITIRVGQLLGKSEPQRARFVGIVGIWMCALFMCCTAVFLLVFRNAVVSLYTDDITVQNIAITLLFMAAIFQIADGVQISAAGALRGYKDTRLPMLINTFSFWVLAFPLAYLAAIVLRAPPNYIWAAFVVGLGFAAVLLTWRYLRVSARAQLGEAEATPY